MIADDCCQVENVKSFFATLRAKRLVQDLKLGLLEKIMRVFRRSKKVGTLTQKKILDFDSKH